MKKVCFFQENTSNGDDKILKYLLDMGYDVRVINNDSCKLLDYASSNKIDVLIIDNINGKTTLSDFAFNTLYGRYIQNIIIIGDFSIFSYDGIYYIDGEKEDIPLALTNVLMRIQQEMDKRPECNREIVRNKIVELLKQFMFRETLSGFNYFVEAAMHAFFEYPFNISIMNVYKSVAKQFKTSPYNIEKSMRMVLRHAYKGIRNCKDIALRDKLLCYLNADITNHTAVQLIVAKLLLDFEISNPVKQYFVNNY